MAFRESSEWHQELMILIQARMDGVWDSASSDPSIHPSAGRRKSARDATMLDERSSPILRLYGSEKTSSRMFPSHVAVFLDCCAVLARGSPKAGVTARMRGVSWKP